MFEKILHSEVGHLLLYIPSYGVLICKACQFAVQPTALSGHLLKHQIYRTERKQLLDKISTLALHEPEDVPYPPPGCTAFPDLPVYDGFCCNAPGCSRTYISQKRMSQHWTQSHHRHSSHDTDCRPVHLQSFFKGNKIRYFEVSLSTPWTLSPPSGESMSGKTHGRVSSMPRFMEKVPNSRARTMGMASRSYLFETLSTALDLEALKLLHHYTTSTSRTISRGVESALFWAQDIPATAFEHEFLMYGILSVSAFHLSSLSCEPSTALAYQKKALRYQSAGLPGFRAAVTNPTIENSTALIAFAWLLGVQRCAEALPRREQLTVVAADDSISPIIEFLVLMRGGCEMVLKLQHLLPANSDFLLLGETIGGLMNIDCDDSSSLEQFTISSHRLQFLDIPFEAYQRLSNLPLLLKEALPASNSGEITIVIPAITCLLESYLRSCTSDGALGLWNSIEYWVLQTSDEFLNLLKGGHPAALVVCAHWCVLMRKTESCYWFMKGQSARLLNIVEGHLAGNIGNLVKGLSND